MCIESYSVDTPGTTISKTEMLYYTYAVHINQQKKYGFTKFKKESDDDNDYNFLSKGKRGEKGFINTALLAAMA